MVRKSHYKNFSALLPFTDTALISEAFDGTILAWNKGATKIYGYSAKEVIGKNVSLIVPKHKQQELEELFEKCRQKKTTTNILTQRLTKSGQLKTVFFSLAPIVDNKGKIIGATTLARDITERIIENQQQKLLLRATTLFSSSLDYRKTLSKIARLIVPNLADWCAIDLLNDNNELELLAVSHVDRGKVEWAKELRKKYPPNMNRNIGSVRVLRTGKAEFIPLITDEFIEKSINSEEERAIINKIGLASIIIVPLKTLNKVIGTLSFISSTKDHLFTKQDLAFAQLLADRAATAIDNAQLYQKAQKEIEVRKKTEEELRLNQDRLELAQDAGKIGTYEIDLQKKTITWSDEINRVFGINRKVRKAHQGLLSQYIYIDDRDRVLYETDKAIKTHKPLNTQYRVQLANKSFRWIAAKAQVYYDKNNKPIKMIGVTFDITNLKTAEERWHASELRFRRLSDAHIVGMIIASIDGKILDANNTFTRMLGYSLKDIKQGKISWKEITPQEFRRVDKKAQDELLKKGSCTPFEKEFITKDGKILPVLIGIAMLDDSKEKCVAFVIDITEKKHLEKRKDDFISVASHELKTPITSTKALGQLLERRIQKINDSQSLELVQKLNTQLSNMSQLVSDLLDVSRIQMGKLRVEKKETNIDDLVSQTIELVQRVSPTHTIRFEQRKTITIPIDRERIMQVITNLLTNAVKYSHPGTDILVRIKDKKEAIIIEVQDFGRGIDKAQFNAIFGRFFQIKDEADPLLDGLGIGLYISSEIIRRHNGTIWVESSIGKGSTFFVSLPRN